MFHTVTAVHVTTTRDSLGDSTETTTETVVRQVLFAPEGATESVFARSPALVGNASLYGAFPDLDADDVVRHDSSCCGGRQFQAGEWAVVGGGRNWGAHSVVPIRRTGEV